MTRKREQPCVQKGPLDLALYIPYTMKVAPLTK
jgi:hypothetical protein